MTSRRGRARGRPIHRRDAEGAGERLRTRHRRHSAATHADQALSITPPAPSPEVRDDVRAYRIADLNDLGRSVEPGRFYDASYRQALSAMIDHVLAVEGPIYEELLIKRIARAHDIQRVGRSSGRRSPTGSILGRPNRG